MDVPKFHFSTLDKNESGGSLEFCEQVAEIVRKKLNILDEWFPWYEGLTRWVRQIISTTKKIVAPSVATYTPPIDEIIRIRQSLNFCTFPVDNKEHPLENHFEAELRRWHELRTIGALVGQPCVVAKRETQRKIVRRYFSHIDTGKLEQIFQMYADDINYLRVTFSRKKGRIVSVTYPPFGDIVSGPVAIPSKADFMSYYRRGRDMTGKHIIQYIVNGAQGWVFSEWSYEGHESASGKDISIPRWRDIVRFNSIGEIDMRYSLIEKDE